MVGNPPLRSPLRLGSSKPFIQCSSLTTACAEMTHLNSCDASSSRVSHPSGARARLAISGMCCGSCKIRVYNCVLDHPGVLKAVVEMGRSIATVWYDPQATSPAAIAERITAAGYISHQTTEGATWGNPGVPKCECGSSAALP